MKKFSDLTDAKVNHSLLFQEYKKFMPWILEHRSTVA